MTIRQVRSISFAWVAVLGACTSPPRWVAVAGEADGAVVRFDSDLQAADTVRLALPADRANAVRRIAITQGGAGILVRLTEPDRVDAIERLRLATGDRVDGWNSPDAIQTTTWLPLPDGRSILAAGAAQTATGTAQGYVSFLTVGRAWRAHHVEACAGVPVAFTLFAEIDRAYLACRAATAALVVIDTRLGRVIEASSAGLEGCDPADLAISRTGGFLFVPCHNSGTLLYLDRVTLQPMDSIPLEPGISLLAVSTRDPQAVVLQPDRAEVVMVSLRDRSVRERVGTGGAPLDVALSGDGRWAFILTNEATAQERSLLKLDLKRRQITGKRPVPAGTRTVTVWPGARSPVMDWR